MCLKLVCKIGSIKRVPAIIVYGNLLKGKAIGFLKRVEAEYQGSK